MLHATSIALAPLILPFTATPPNASTLVTAGIPALAVLVFALASVMIWRLSSRAGVRFVVAAGLYLFVTGTLAASGFYARGLTEPPRMASLVVPAIGLALALALSPLGRKVATETPLPLLVGFHGFRLPLELVMHHAAAEGTMPEQMTFTGYNFDIATGISALILAFALTRSSLPRALVLAWNLFGIALLFAIMAIAIASLPAFRAFGSSRDRLNTWVAFFPFIWLPAALVPAALFGHLVLFRRLLGRASRQTL